MYIELFYLVLILILISYAANEVAEQDVLTLPEYSAHCHCGIAVLN